GQERRRRVVAVHLGDRQRVGHLPWVDRQPRPLSVVRVQLRPHAEAAALRGELGRRPRPRLTVLGGQHFTQHTGQLFGHLGGGGEAPLRLQSGRPPQQAVERVELGEQWHVLLRGQDRKSVV